MATNDIGRVTPIWRGFYSAATAYELNDIVIDQAGSVWWHKGQTITTGTAPAAGETWAAVIDMSVFSGLIQAAITTAQTALAAAQEAVAEITADTERAETAAENAEASALSASESAASVGAYAQAAEEAKNAAQTAASQAAASASSAGASASSAGSSAQAAEASKTAAQTAASQAAGSAETASGAAAVVEQKKAEALAAIEAKGEEVLESIPADYTELSGDVNDLKSVTEKIADEPEIVITDLSGYTEASGNIGNTTGNYSDVNSTTKTYKHIHIDIPRSGGTVTVTASAGMAAYFWFVSEYAEPVNGQSANVLEDGNKSVAAGRGPTPFPIPDGCGAIVIQTARNPTVNTPAAFNLTIPAAHGELTAKVEENTADIEDVQGYLDPIRQGPEYYVRDSLDGCEIHDCNIGSEGKWNNGSTYKHVVIPVTGGMEVTLTASANGQLDLAVLKEYTVPSNGDPIRYCGGDMWDHKLMQSAGSEYKSLLPYDARYIAIVVNKNGTDTTPTAFSLTYTNPGPVKWCAMGDSITEGTCSAYIDGGGTESKTPRDRGWARQVALINRWDLTNMALGGTGYLNTRDKPDPQDPTHTIPDPESPGYYKARNNDFSPFDLVTVALGINDWKATWVGIDDPMGDIDDPAAQEPDDPTTIISAMKTTIEAIMASNPACKIIVILPMNIRGYSNDRFSKNTKYARETAAKPKTGTLDEFADKMIEVCDLYGIQYIDMTRYSPLNTENMETLLPDGVHPSAEAHRLIARELAQKITF